MSSPLFDTLFRPTTVSDVDASAAPVRERGTRSRAGNAMNRTRTALLDAAAQCVAEDGTKITMAGVAARAMPYCSCQSSFLRWNFSTVSKDAASGNGPGFDLAYGGWPSPASRNSRRPLLLSMMGAGPVMAQAYGRSAPTKSPADRSRPIDMLVVDVEADLTRPENARGIVHGVVFGI